MTFFNDLCKWVTLPMNFLSEQERQCFKILVIKSHVVSLKVLRTPDIRDKLDLPNGLGLTQQGTPSFERTPRRQCLNHMK